MWQNSNQVTLGILWKLCSFQQVKQLAQNKSVLLSCAKWQELLGKLMALLLTDNFSIYLFDSRWL